jgi:hypothetical protein
MTTQLAVGAARLQPSDLSKTRVLRDCSINDYLGVVNPHIFGNYVLSQTTPCLKGASNPHVCRTAENRSQFS